jgi:hypothetical protein
MQIRNSVFALAMHAAIPASGPSFPEKLSVTTGKSN